MKNVLFISYDGMTDSLGQSQVIPYLVRLTQFDYKFTILSCDKPKKYHSHKNYIQNLLKPFPVTWISLPYHKNPAVVSTLYDVYQLRKKAKELHLKHNFDLVHTRPGIPSLIGLWLKKKFHVKFLNDIREFYADSRVEGGMWNTKNIFYKAIYNYFKSHEEEAVAKSDGIVCLTFAAENIIRNFSMFQQKIPLSVIPCSVDMKLFDPGNINPELKSKFEKELGIDKTDFIISYLGSIGGWYLTDEKMQFCKIAVDKMPELKFLFIAPKDQHDEIRDAAKKFKIPQEKILIKHAERWEVPTLLSFSNYSVFFIKSCYSKKSSSPTKHGEIMAMGIPVITNAGVGDVEEIVKKYHSGIVLKNLDEKEFEFTANVIAEGISFDKTAIRNGAKEYFDLDKAVEKYRNIYDKIILNN